MLQAAGEVNVVVKDGAEGNVSLDQQKILGINRQESLGLLSSGFIHGINNILGVLYGYMELAVDECKSNMPVADYINQAILSADKARLLVHQLHEFGRKCRHAESVVDLRNACELPLGMVQSVFPSSIRIESQWAEGECWVRLNPRSWHQVMVNLLLNAREAMAEGGVITLSLRKETDKRCCLAIQDHGQGMTPEILSLALTPFFSTKPSGEGSGLGLTASRILMEEMGGSLGLDSIVGEGTRVRLTLPLSKDPPPRFSCRSM